MARPVKAEKIKKPIRKAAAIAVVSISLAAGGLGGYFARNPGKLSMGRAKPAEVFASKKPEPEPEMKEEPQKDEKKQEVWLERLPVPQRNKEDVKGEERKTAQEPPEDKNKGKKEGKRPEARGKKRKKSISDEELIEQMRGPRMERPEVSCTDAYESIAVMRALKAGRGDEVKRYFERKKARKERAEKREEARKEMARMKKRAERNRVKIKPQGPGPKRPEVTPHMGEPHVPVDRKKYQRYGVPEKCVDGKIECSPF